MGILRNPTQSISVRPTRSASSDITTSGESIIFVDTTSNPVTVTLASGDAQIGRQITIADSGGNASNNNITINTEGSQVINGNASLTIESDYGAQAIGSDGDNWFTTGAGGGGGGSFGLFTVRYDSSNDDLRWRDAENGQDRMALDRTTGNLRIEGSFTEGSAL
jgi:hypothetical protein